MRLWNIIVLTALLLTGCEGMYFKYPIINIDVECSDGSAEKLVNSVPIGPGGREVESLGDLPQKGPKQPEKGTSVLTPTVYRTSTSSAPAYFILPVEHLEDPSCATEDRTTSAIAQQDDSWCWAASAETVMKFHLDNPPPNTSQCNIVDTVFNNGDPSNNDDQASCCSNQCQHNDLPEAAFGPFGFTYARLDVVQKGAQEPGNIRAQVCDNGPFIFILHYTKDGRLSGGGHSFVVADYMEQNGKLYLFVHDHGSHNTRNGRVPNAFTLWSYDDYVNGRWDGRNTYRHSFDYIQISH